MMAVEVQSLDRPIYLPPTIGSPNRVNHAVTSMAEATATSSKTIIQPGGERLSLKGGGVMVHVVYSGRAKSELSIPDPGLSRLSRWLRRAISASLSARPIFSLPSVPRQLLPFSDRAAALGPLLP